MAHHVLPFRRASEASRGNPSDNHPDRGMFDRTIAIPIPIDPDRIRAEYRDGVLALFLPRAEREKPRSIKIA
jgi:HSP20 family molecular chaperone IbpA